MHIIGDVVDKEVIMIDDMIDTGGTIINAAVALKKLGAKKIFASCTHPVFSGGAIEKIENSVLDEMVVTNTIPLEQENLTDKIKVISVGKLIAHAIQNIHNGESISPLFDQVD